MAEAFIISLCCSVSLRHPDMHEGIEQAMPKGELRLNPSIIQKLYVFKCAIGTDLSLLRKKNLCMHLLG